MLVGVVLTLPGLVEVISLAGPRGLHLPAILRAGEAQPLLLLLLGLAVVGVLIFSIGLVAYVIVSSLSPQRAAKGYGSVGTILACLGVAVIVANLLTLPYGLIVQAQHPNEPFILTPGGLVYSVVALDGALLLVLYLRIVRPKVLSWAQLGLTGRQLDEQILRGIGVGIGVILGSAAVEALLRAVGIQQTQEEMFAGVRSASLPQFIGILLAAAVIAPIAEEIFFRGYVFTAARRTYGVPVAFALSAVLFGLAHLNLQALIPILLIGLVFCYVYWKTGSLVPTMVAHAMNNAVALISLYFFHQ